MSAKKSLKLNMVLNAFKGMLSILFPLISFPYVSKILGVENLGRYNFAHSIINYFLLIAALGLKTYAVREGAKLRDTKEEFAKFANQMFTINMISTAISYLLFMLTLVLVPKFAEYRALLLIFSLQILFTTIGVEWIYTIYEDFSYITLLSIISHIFSLAALFLLVKTENDLNVYAGITVLAGVGTNLINLIHCRKYCRIRFVGEIDWNKHLKPIFVLFAMQIATTIYISSDTTILGFLCNDSIVGIYSVSTKIYTIIKTILSSVIIVSIPRLASLTEDKFFRQFNDAAKDIYGTLLTVVVPAIVGMIVLRKEIILIISNENYLAATSSLSILCVALLFCLCAWFWGQCILVPKNMEGFVFKSTLLSAVVNIVLNFIMIPIWAENAAAITTLIAEALAFIVQWYKGRKYVDFSEMIKLYVKVIIGCVAIVAIAYLCMPLKSNVLLYTMTVMILSVLGYGGIEIALKNESVYSVIDIFKKKLRKK